MFFHPFDSSKQTVFTLLCTYTLSVVISILKQRSKFPCSRSLRTPMLVSSSIVLDHKKNNTNFDTARRCVGVPPMGHPTNHTLRALICVKLVLT